jgi:hypothetical protein
MNTSTRIALVLLCIGLAARVWPHVATVSPAPSPAPDRPSDALATAVAPVAAILKESPEDGRRLAAFYLALSDVIARDEGRLIQTTAHLRELNRRAGLLAFQQTGIDGKHAGLAEAIDKALADQVGLANVPLDADKRKRALAAFSALAWACGGSHA